MPFDQQPFTDLAPDHFRIDDDAHSTPLPHLSDDPAGHYESPQPSPDPDAWRRDLRTLEDFLAGC